MVLPGLGRLARRLQPVQMGGDARPPNRPARSGAAVRSQPHGPARNRHSLDTSPLGSSASHGPAASTAARTAGPGSTQSRPFPGIRHMAKDARYADLHDSNGL